MAAYLVADVEVLDAGAYEQYKQALPASLEPFGARYVVRGGAAEVLEGDWNPARLVIIEFPDMARLKAWYASPAYRPLIALRQRCARARLLAIEGA
jgi:uncharacterized protein (DUF1330 family)